MDKDKLIKIGKLTGTKFAEFKDGVTTYLESGEVIPVELVFIPSWWIRNKKEHANGIYRLIEYTCDGGGKDNDCKVGSPAKSCWDSGLVIRDCAKYKLDKPWALISLQQCLKLMENENE